MDRNKHRPHLGRTVGRAIDSALGKFGQALGSTIHIPKSRTRAATAINPGAPPGVEHLANVDKPPAPNEVIITVIDYCPDRVEYTDVTNLDEFLGAPRPEWAAVRWINVDGLHPYIVNKFREAMHFHTLAAEDVLHVPQRPRVEPYDNHLFLVTRMLRLLQGKLICEQVSFFFWCDTLLTFQEKIKGDVWGHVRERVSTKASKVRQGDTGFLLYSLLDALVDELFPIVEEYGDVLEDIEEKVIDAPGPEVVRRLHGIRHDMVMLRRVIWPTRLMLNDLQTREDSPLKPAVRMFLRDVHEHALQLIDIVETYRDMAGGMMELYLSSVSFRMNEIMKVLTIMATLFIPITFLAGVYGMNFKYFPELEYRWAYPAFWGVCLLVIGGLLIFFYRKGWLTKSE
jgi:magnesium transporter